MTHETLSVVAVALFGAAAVATAAAGQLSSTFTNWLDHPAIGYAVTQTSDPVAELNRKLQAGSVRLTSEGPSGYLRSLLNALNVSIDSQVVVFAKDSVQRAIISAANPRALYFNDSVAVGWVRGGFIEIASQDPVQGTVFYALRPSMLGQPHITRGDSCLSCHYSYSTAGVPGMLVRSSGEFAVNHTLPFERRWGSWYVTGSSGSMRHLGNVDVVAPPPLSAFNWPSLANRLDTTGYLSEHSDVVALMVFDHQMHLMNLLTRMGWEARVLERQQRAASTRSNNDEAPIPLDDAAREVVDYMLFVDEAQWPDAVKGSSGFVERFERLGPSDRAGRSLRQFDLRRRLMRFPCSYLIYAPVFTNLPDSARDAIYRRMWDVLSGEDASPKYRRLTASDRRAVVEILRDTKGDLPPYFRVQGPSPK